MSDIENKQVNETNEKDVNQEDEKQIDVPDKDKKEKPNTIKEVLMGLGIPILGLLAAMLISRVGLKSSEVMISYLVILAVLGFIDIKFFRTNHKTAAFIMLTLLTPAILFFMVFGACFLMLSGIK